MTIVRQIGKSIVPAWARARWRDAVLLSEARKLRSAARGAADPRSDLELAWSSRFCPLQRKTEILALLHRVQEMRPSTLCEIGTAGGGTTFLFARAAAQNALVVSIDLKLPWALRRAVASWRRPQQRIVGLPRNSQSEQTVAEVRSLLKTRRLDFLFIDGDHSYEGVSRDFLLYRPLVRPGGLIALHDIVPDHETRFGLRTGARTGGVPRFWREIRSRYRFEEYVEDPEQDGYGIGVVWND